MHNEAATQLLQGDSFPPYVLWGSAPNSKGSPIGAIARLSLFLPPARHSPPIFDRVGAPRSALLSVLIMFV